MRLDNKEEMTISQKILLWVVLILIVLFVIALIVIAVVAMPIVVPIVLLIWFFGRLWKIARR